MRETIKETDLAKLVISWLAELHKNFAEAETQRGR
jgi:hypothetical protein